MADKPKRETTLAPLQLDLLKNVQGMTLQSIFEGFCNQAKEVLTSVRSADGEPVFEAGKAASEFEVKVRISRVTDDSRHFSIEMAVKEKHPFPPGVSKTVPDVRGVGLAQQVSNEQLSIFDADAGQPEPMSIEEARKTVRVDD